MTNGDINMERFNSITVSWVKQENYECNHLMHSELKKTIQLLSDLTQKLTFNSCSIGCQCKLQFPISVPGYSKIFHYIHDVMFHSWTTELKTITEGFVLYNSLCCNSFLIANILKCILCEGFRGVRPYSPPVLFTFMRLHNVQRSRIPNATICYLHTIANWEFGKWEANGAFLFCSWS